MKHTTNVWMRNASIKPVEALSTFEKSASRALSANPNPGKEATAGAIALAATEGVRFDLITLQRVKLS